jgi:SAM-dependent methyltransferase
MGAGAGRASLAVQECGQEVVALDISPGAVEVCRRRGVEQVFCGTVAELAVAGPAKFDSVLMLGNNLGLLGSPQPWAAGLAAARPHVLAALGGVLRPGQS